MSLLEMLVACTLFALLAGAVFWIQKVGGQAFRKREVAQQCQQEALTALEHLRRELGQGSDLSAPLETTPEQPSTQLIYSVPLRDAEGNIQLTGDEPAMDPNPVTVELDPRGRLVRRCNGRERVLAHLGPDGTAVFVRESTDILRVDLHSEVKNPDPSRASSYDLRARIFVGK